MVGMLIIPSIEKDFVINIDYWCEKSAFDSILVATFTFIPSLAVNTIQIDVAIAHVLKITITSIIDQKVFLKAN